MPEINVVLQINPNVYVVGGVEAVVDTPSSCDKTVTFFCTITNIFAVFFIGPSAAGCHTD